jgi:hypothetical protein
VHWSGYDTTALDIEVDPQRCRFGSRKSDFAPSVSRVGLKKNKKVLESKS